jgi:predicted deacetylase
MRQLGKVGSQPHLMDLRDQVGDFMKAQYLLRFDDICPTMNWVIWARIEKVLRQHNIRPILGIVPDNRDPGLVIGEAQADFWQRVRDWQSLGWGIALHGYQHVYESQCSGLLGINRFSEFAGLPERKQRDKLSRAIAIVRQQGVQIDIWIAPGHSFDPTTVRLLLEFGINLISDGFYLRPVTRLNATWIPQQLWRLKLMPFGLWTVCYHHNSFTDVDLERFELQAHRFASKVVSIHQILRERRISDVGLLDAACAAVGYAGLRLRKWRT